MKKMMFGLAAAAAISTFAIESANVVGYQAKELAYGLNDFVVQTFLPMGKTVATTKLGDISVTEDWDALNGDYIATLTPEGANSAEYTYLIKAYAEALGGDVAGWYIAEEVNDGDVSTSGCQNDVVLPYAQGFLAYNNSGAKLQFAGEVVAGDTELATALGMNAFSGNASPVDITLADLTVSDDWDALNGDYIATLTPEGANSAEYTYLIKAYAEALGGDVAGWYIAEEVNDGDVSVSGCQNDVVISAGQALLIYQNSGATVTLPSAL